MLRRVFLLLMFVLATTAGQHLLAAPVAAQRARVEVTLPVKAKLATERPIVRAIGIIAAKQTAELISNGFPARLHFKIERWTGGTLVNEVKATVQWEVIVEYDALNKVYRVIRATTDRAVVLGEFTQLRDAEAKVAEAYQPAITLPQPKQKSYYTVTLDVETMSLSDLDEVRRWIKGELRPAMRGQRNPGTAVTSGIRKIFVKLMGGERVRYQTNTKVFTP